MTAFHRFNRSSKTPDNGCGYMMFAANQDHVEHYGDHHWTFDGNGCVEIDDVVCAAREAGFEDAFYAADAFAPAEIVDSANAWDDMDAVMWLWENVCDARDWHAIRTNNGAIIFDPALAVYAGERVY